MSESSRILALALLGMVASWYVLPGLWAAMLTFLGRILTGIRSHKTVVDGIRWHYLEGGQGPVLVLLHGVAGESDHWLAIAGNVRRRCRTLIPDLPGFGASEPPDELSFRIREQSARVAAWLDALGVEDCILAGNSMGSWIAADLAATRPERVRGLWLQAPFGVLSAEPSEVLAAMARGERNPFAVSSIAEYRELAGTVRNRRFHVPYPLAHAGFVLARRLHPHMERMQREMMEESEPLEALASRLTMPVLIEWGSDDRAVHVSGARILHELLAASEVELREDIGHLPLLECPYESAQGFLEFAENHGVLEKENGTRQVI